MNYKNKISLIKASGDYVAFLKGRIIWNPETYTGKNTEINKNFYDCNEVAIRRIEKIAEIEGITLEQLMIIGRVHYESRYENLDKLEEIKNTLEHKW